MTAPELGGCASSATTSARPTITPYITRETWRDPRWDSIACSTSGRSVRALLPVHRGEQRPRAAAVAVLAQVDPLPGPEREPAAADRQGERRAEQGCLD